MLTELCLSCMRRLLCPPLALQIYQFAAVSCGFSSVMHRLQSAAVECALLLVVRQVLVGSTCLPEACAGAVAQHDVLALCMCEAVHRC